MYLHGNSDWFVHDRFGMFIHWGIYSLAARHEKVILHEHIPMSRYETYATRFEPDLFDPAEWAKTARKAGMKYVVFTAKHHDGFCMFDTRFTEFKSTNTPGGRDYVREISEAFRAEGLRIGLYYSLLDWHHPDFTIDRCHPETDNPEERAKNAFRHFPNYTQYMRDQVAELLTNYGKIDILWFDFSYPGPDGKGAAEWESEKLVVLARRLQPEILLDNRLDLPGAGDILTPEQYLPSNGMRDENGKPQVWEGCHTFSGSWGYFRDEYTWKSVEQLVRILIDNTSRGGNTLLNVGPTARGEFDDRAGERLAGIAEWMRRHKRSIHGCTAAPEWVKTPENCRFTYHPETGRLYLHLFAWPLKELHLPGLAGKVAYAQLLNDSSEIKIRTDYSPSLADRTPDGALTIQLPVIKPDVTIPVIELFPEHSFQKEISV